MGLQMFNSKVLISDAARSVKTLLLPLVIIIMLYLRNVLHKYANEDVSLGSWFIGLDVEHVDRRLCCGTPPGNSYNIMSHKHISVSLQGAGYWGTFLG